MTKIHTPAAAHPEINLAYVGDYLFVREVCEDGRVSYTAEPADCAEDTYSSLYCVAGHVRFTSYVDGKRDRQASTR